MSEQPARFDLAVVGAGSGATVSAVTAEARWSVAQVAVVPPSGAGPA